MFKLKTGIVFLFYIGAIMGNAQTKLIAHKSHSGSMATFNINHHFTIADEWYSNFGVAPQRFIKQAYLDTVIYINDTITVVITSKHCINEYYQEDKEIWSEGKDTIKNHPVFSQNIPLDSMKKILKTQYYFKNPIDSVRFLNFENKQIQKQNYEQQNNQNLFPPLYNNGSKHTNIKPFLILSISLIAFVAGLLISIFKQLKNA